MSFESDLSDLCLMYEDENSIHVTNMNDDIIRKIIKNTTLFHRDEIFLYIEGVGECNFMVISTNGLSLTSSDFGHHFLSWDNLISLITFNSNDERIYIENIGYLNFYNAQYLAEPKTGLLKKSTQLFNEHYDTITKKEPDRYHIDIIIKLSIIIALDNDIEINKAINSIFTLLGNHLTPNKKKYYHQYLVDEELNSKITSAPLRKIKSNLLHCEVMLYNLSNLEKDIIGETLQNLFSIINQDTKLNLSKYL